MTQIPTDEGKGTGSGFEPEAGTRLAGDVDGDGDVDFADVTKALALKLPFEEVTKVLAGMAPASGHYYGMDWRVYTEPPARASRGAITWSEKGTARFVRAESETTTGVEVSGGTIRQKVSPPSGSDPATRWLRFTGCRIEGDGGPLPVADPRAWGGGVWFQDCSFRNVQACCPGAMAFQSCSFEDITSDVFHNVRAVRDVAIMGLRKPRGSTAHPDLYQHSWPVGTVPGPMAVMGLRASNVNAQAIFFRSAVKLPAVCLSDVIIELSPDCKYVSQAMRDLGEIRIDRVRITREGMAKPLQIRNDPAAGIAPTRLDSLVVIDSDVVIDPSIVIGG